MNLQMKIHREVELHIDKMYGKTEQLGKLAVQVFGRDRGKAQLRNLENIANSTLKVSDVLDYIKRQTARMNEWKKQNFGLQMLSYVQKEIEAQKENIFENLKTETQFTQQEVKELQGHEGEFKKQEIAMQLIRGFVKQLVIHFEWALAQGRQYGITVRD
jgi:hypothetical protein